MFSIRVTKPMVVCLCLFLLFVCSLPAQETTGGIVGTVKDPSGASVPNATVCVTASSLVGTKTVQTDARQLSLRKLATRQLHLTITARVHDRKADVRTRSRSPADGGHRPRSRQNNVGIEVTGAAPQIDTTTNVTTTNVTEDVIQNIPHGRSFQSVIQFAPQPATNP